MQRWKNRAIEPLEPRHMLTIPYGAMPNDTAEFLLGDVMVNVVFMESDGTLDQDLEDWTPASIAATKAKITEGVQWWSQLLAQQESAHELNFIFDFTFADTPVQTGYEPIDRPSNDYRLWAEDFLDAAGANTDENLATDIRAFNHQQRVNNDTDWAFTILVVNSESDENGRFATGGDFSLGFAFPGGQFMVLPSTRPASSFAHETGHIFWAHDEYAGSTDYTASRGYYNTQNLNATDGHPNPTERVDSIMATHQVAFDDFAISESAKEMLGWRDSDDDGIFDVLDVPLSLSGSGRYDAETESYRFIGEASVNTLPNENPSGLGNDITINEVTAIEFSIDGRAWRTAETFSDHSISFDITLTEIPSDVGFIEFRAIDSRSGVTSKIFTGQFDRAMQTDVAGISGFAFDDRDSDGTFDSDELGIAGLEVTLANADGSPIRRGSIDPDRFELESIIDTEAIGVSAIGSDLVSNDVFARNAATRSTGVRVFGSETTAGPRTTWSADRMIRFDFATPISQLRIDAVADTDLDVGRVEIYDANDQLIARSTTQALMRGEFETIHLVSDDSSIAYALAMGHADTAIRFDNLQLGPDTQTTTDALGAYSFEGLQPDDYLVQIQNQDDRTPTDPNERVQTVTHAAGATTTDVDFGSRVTATLTWTNPENHLDVSGDGLVIPQDVLILVNAINDGLTGELADIPGVDEAPPYYDVNGDGFLTAGDAIWVINYLNSQADGGSQDSEPAEGEMVFFGDVDVVDTTESTALADAEPATAVSPSSVSADPIPFVGPVRLGGRVVDELFAGDRLFDQPQPSQHNGLIGDEDVLESAIDRTFSSV